MTLTTHIHVVDPAPIDEVWAFCRDLVTIGTEWEGRIPPFTDEFDDVFVYNEGGESRWEEDRQARRRWNQAGVGCNSLLHMTYAVERPLPTDYETAEYIKMEEDPPPGHFIDVSFDTPYGYRENGAGCSDQHAWFIVELGTWLASMGKRIRWQQEFTGEWYDSLLDIHELGDPERGNVRRSAA